MSNLPKGWEWSTLSEVAKWGSGGTPKKGIAGYYDGTIPWAVIGDLNDGVVTECANSITDLGLSKSSAKLVERGTILIAMYGSIGKLGVAGNTMATNQAIAFARPHDCLDPAYLFNYLLSQRNSLNSEGKGAAQLNISQTILKAWPIPVPPLPEQRRIVAAIEEHFSRLDAAEASLNDARRRLDNLDVAWSAQTLVGDWEVFPLGDVAEVKAGPFGSALTKKSYSKTGFKVYGQEQVLRNDPYFGDYFVPAAKFEELATCATTPGDLLVSLVGSIGRTLILPPDAAPGIINPRLVRIRPRHEGISVQYLQAVLDSPITQARLRLNAHGGTMDILNGRMLKEVEVALPDLVTQSKIVSDLHSLQEANRRIRDAIDVLTRRQTRLHRSILAAAFSGRLVPQDPSDEPASALLERIAAERAASKPTRKKKAAS